MKEILKFMKKNPPTLSVIECCNITTFTYLRTTILQTTKGLSQNSCSDVGVRYSNVLAKFLVRYNICTKSINNTDLFLIIFKL